MRLVRELVLVVGSGALAIYFYDHARRGWLFGGVIMLLVYGLRKLDRIEERQIEEGVARERARR